jgi:hypothetical protein
MHPQIVCSLDMALEDCQKERLRASPIEEISMNQTSFSSSLLPLCSPLASVLPNCQLPPTGTFRSLTLSKIEALHGSYLAIVFPSSAGKFSGNDSTGNTFLTAGPASTCEVFSANISSVPCSNFIISTSICHIPMHLQRE